MFHVSTVPLSELNQHFICGICFGYIVDATTIIECPHSFCRSCLVQYLSTENCCPLCGQLIHKTKPLDYIRADKILQDLAYKLIPGLYTDERRRRQDFRSSLGENGSSTIDNWSDEDEEKSPVLDTSDANERLSVCLQLADARQSPDNRAKIRSNDRRYLLCPAYVSVSVLKKFIRIKFELSAKHRVAMFYADDDLPDHYTLTDVATLYGWRRMCPLKLFYIVFNPSRLRHLVFDKSSLSYITYRRLIKKHRREYSSRLNRTRDQTAERVPAEPSIATGHPGELTCSLDENIDKPGPVTDSTLSTVRITTRANSGQMVESRSSFTISRLLSLSDDESGSRKPANAADVDANVRKLCLPVSTEGHRDGETAASQHHPGAVGDGRDSTGEVNPVPVHFKKRMISTATLQSVPIGPGTQPAVIGQSAVPRRQFTIHEDQLPPSTSTPPTKVGIVISHGKAMTLQDKLQMTTPVSRSPASAPSEASPLLYHNSTPVAPPCRMKGRLKRVVKTSLTPASKACGRDENGNENEINQTHSAGDVKRPRRKSSKRSELELLLQLDGGTLAASAEFRKANALQPRDNIILPGPSVNWSAVHPTTSHDVIKTFAVTSAPYSSASVHTSAAPTFP